MCLKSWSLQGCTEPREAGGTARARSGGGQGTEKQTWAPRPALQDELEQRGLATIMRLKYAHTVTEQSNRILCLT